MSDSPNQPPPDGAPPPHYQPVAGPSSLSLPSQPTTALSLSETRALSSFLSVGRVLDFDEWLTFTHGGALEWDLKSEVPPLGTQVEKHGNLGVWILGDKEPPLLKLSHIKLLGLNSKGLIMTISVASNLITQSPSGPTIPLGPAITLHHPANAVVGPTSRISIDGTPTNLSSPSWPIPWPLFAETLYLKPVQFTRAGMGAGGAVNGIRLRVVWAQARTQESYWKEEGFVERLEAGLDRIPRS